MEDTLSQDMTTLSAYFQVLRLKLSYTKTVTAAFHLNNREAKRELNVYNNGNLLPPCPVSTYLGVKLGRSLTFHHHLEALRKKISSLHPSCTVEATCRIRMECRCQDIARLCSFLGLLQLSTAHQFGVAVRILASLTAFSMILCALSLDACVPHQRRACLSSQASSQLSSVD